MFKNRRYLRPNDDQLYSLWDIINGYDLSEDDLWALLDLEVGKSYQLDQQTSFQRTNDNG